MNGIAPERMVDPDDHQEPASSSEPNRRVVGLSIAILDCFDSLRILKNLVKLVAGQLALRMGIEDVPSVGAIPYDRPVIHMDF